jgi:hypothetical protein
MRCAPIYTYAASLTGNLCPHPIQLAEHAKSKRIASVRGSMEDERAEYRRGLLHYLHTTESPLAHELA